MTTTTTTTRNATTTTTTRQPLPTELANFLAYVIIATQTFVKGFRCIILGNRTYTGPKYLTGRGTSQRVRRSGWQVPMSVLPEYPPVQLPESRPAPADHNRDRNPAPTDEQLRPAPVQVRFGHYVGTMRLDVPTDAPAPARKSRAPRTRKAPTRKGNGPTPATTSETPTVEPTTTTTDPLAGLPTIDEHAHMNTLREACRGLGIKAARSKAETLARIRAAQNAAQTPATTSETPTVKAPRKARKAK